jgi:hypothetical protein
LRPSEGDLHLSAQFQQIMHPGRPVVQTEQQPLVADQDIGLG